LRKRDYFIPFLIIFILSVGLIIVNMRGKLGPLRFAERWGLSLFVPVQSLFVKTIRGVERFWAHYLYLVDLSQENRRLREQIDRLKLENNRYREIERHYQRLVRLLGLKELLSFKTIAAEIIGRDYDSWFRSLYIDKGASQGVKRGMVVISPDGLVGQVLATSSHNAKVLLITDIRSSVAALIQRSRSNGIVIGSVNNGCKMKYLPLDADIRVGDRVISSGLGGVFPKGLLIGRVKRIDREQASYFLNAEIVPSVDMDKLEEVLVILD